MDRPTLVKMTLIGKSDVAQIMIVTPIPAMFTALLRAGWSKSSADGWWPCASRGNVDAVLIPQGGAVADLCQALSPGQQLELLGYGGALGTHFAIGEVARPSSARPLEGGLETQLRGGTPGTTVVTVSHMLAAYDAHPKNLVGAHVVDMESAHAAVACESFATVGVRLLITDRVPGDPFYSTSPKTRRALQHGRQDLIDQYVSDLEASGAL